MHPELFRVLYLLYPDGVQRRNMDPDLENNVKGVRRSKEEKKILKKQIKASHTLLKHEGINTASQPTKSLVVANGGLGNGVSREELTSLLKEMGELEILIMHPQKPYAFVTYRSEESAQKAHLHLNGQKLQCGENIVTLYLSYVNSVTCEEEEAFASLPEGLTLVEDFVSSEEEVLLLSAIDWSSTNDDVTAKKALKHRKVKHYGFEFRYDNNNVDKDKPLPLGIPQECLPVLERCVKSGLINVMPDQLTVNQYECGQGIPPHVDTHSAFEDTIMSLSLGAQSVMEFRHPDGRLIPVVLPARSLLLMKGESRYLWTHGITPRKYDMVPACDPQSLAHTTADFGTHSNLTLSKRGTRTSFTFRKIRHKPCDCAFPSACDSQGAPSPPSVSSQPPPSLPCSHADAALLEEEYVHQVYNAIASNFSSTRHSPWPRVCQFLNSLPAGSVLVDVGCGNGKYLGVNPDVIAVGCDRSSALVQICAERGFQAFVSDALSVPLRAASCDACISIAVIHHFSTQDRRLAAVKELVRLLKPGGQALIYVWAFEQEYNKQRSKYLKDQNKESPENHSLVKSTSEDSQEPHGKSSQHSQNDCRPDDSIHDVNKVTEAKLSVHTNRTAFNTQDLLVPWHLKEGKKKGEEESGEGGKKDKTKMTLGKPCPATNPDSKPIPSIDTAETSTANQKSESESTPAPVFHRYYHVFQQGELEQLCRKVAGVKVQSSYHDQGNWCVILEKEDVTRS
ncbi:LOW QUALITY PROTEIN: alkylated DNA repair protein alkB homolog 8 [Notolabrus celidotus]|uniref:LOW QUALITY PROTEIN: alkylated DNA repair protein alkB homolog 8 n=1 Tax=Notolabrus celidotus TaxID=1203425 RepID=UPI0014906AF5|nr:LOW QUALITY PROTEIN: alkylated DNA repair protein alkB homolog 8 [Notolabrus celidotus]